MRHFVLPREGLSEDMTAALTRGLGLSPTDTASCERHCRRYGIENVAAFLDELDEARAALATAKALGASILEDWRGRLCYDVQPAPDDGARDEDDAGGWKDDVWLLALLGEKERLDVEKVHDADDLSTIAASTETTGGIGNRLNGP